MKKYEVCLKCRKRRYVIYKFDKCISKQGCDYVALIISLMKLILIECKRGRLGTGDFEDAMNQIEYTMNFFDKSPCNVDLIIICYERANPLVLRHINMLLRKPYKGRIRIILQRFKEKDSICKFLH